MDSFLKKYRNHVFDDWGASCSDDYKSFVRAFKSYIKRNVSCDEVIGFKPNHYDTSGFVRKGDAYIYVYYSTINRIAPLDIEANDASSGVLVRFAENDRDFTGERNQFTSLQKLPDYVNGMFKEKFNND